MVSMPSDRVSRNVSTLGRLGRFVRFLPRRWSGLLAFNYHRIGDPAGSLFDHELWSARVEEFDRQVAFLRRHYDVVHPRDVPGLQRRGSGRHALITFDDGYRDNYQLALPVLRRQRVPAAFFITTGFIDEGRVAWWDEIAWMVRRSARKALPPSAWTNGAVELGEGAIQRLLRIHKRLPSARTAEYLGWLGQATGSGRCPKGEASTAWMTWDMVRELRDAGMAVGGHTVSHPVLSRMDRAGQEAEIAGCARRLHEELGEPMRWFAYPVGGPNAFDQDTRALLAAAGVELAFTYYGGFSRYDDWDPLDVRRIAVELDVSGSRFRRVARWPALSTPRGRGWPSGVRATLRRWVRA
jgi:peptidoglycan/xylan/chitin deacetylase (PgdA/CDA1 family)